MSTSRRQPRRPDQDISNVRGGTSEPSARITDVGGPNNQELNLDTFLSTFPNEPEYEEGEDQWQGLHNRLEQGKIQQQLQMQQSRSQIERFGQQQSNSTQAQNILSPAMNLNRPFRPANFSVFMDFVSRQSVHDCIAIWDRDLELQHYLYHTSYRNGPVEPLFEHVKIFRTILGSRMQFFIKMMWESDPELRAYFCPTGHNVLVGTQNPMSSYELFLSSPYPLLDLKLFLNSPCPEILDEVWRANSDHYALIISSLDDKSKEELIDQALIHHSGVLRRKFISQLFKVIVKEDASLINRIIERERNKKCPSNNQDSSRYLSKKIEKLDCLEAFLKTLPPFVQRSDRQDRASMAPFPTPRSSQTRVIKQTEASTAVPGSIAGSDSSVSLSDAISMGAHGKHPKPQKKKNPAERVEIDLTGPDSSIFSPEAEGTSMSVLGKRPRTQKGKAVPAKKAKTKPVVLSEDKKNLGDEGGEDRLQQLKNQLEQEQIQHQLQMQQLRSRVERLGQQQSNSTQTQNISSPTININRPSMTLFPTPHPSQRQITRRAGEPSSSVQNSTHSIIDLTDADLSATEAEASRVAIETAGSDSGVTLPETTNTNVFGKCQRPEEEVISVKKDETESVVPSSVTLNRRKQTSEKRKAYYEAHKEEKKAYRERKNGLIGEPRQKRQRINPSDDAYMTGNNELNLGIPYTEEIQLRMVDSVFRALERIDPESNLPNQVITPQISSYDLLFGNTSSKTNQAIPPSQEPMENFTHTNNDELNGNVSVPNFTNGNGNNHFYRNPPSARQLLFGDKKQTVSLGSQELGQAKLPSEKEREENFINNLFNF